MRKKSILGIILVALLTGCNGTSNPPSIDDSSAEVPSSEINSSGDEGSESSSGSDSSSELPPLNDPAVSGLTQSEDWPSAAVSDFLSYDADILLPVLTSETSFHHGLVNDELFYRVLTRVRGISDFQTYKAILENEYDFTFELEMPNVYYGTTMYDEVRVYLGYDAGSTNDVTFDFFDGSGDNYKGLKAVDGLAFFDLTTQAAVAKKSPTRVKWEVRPATFTVYKGSAGYNVGHDNYAELSNPLRLYAGQEALFAVSNQYVITNIKILAASGYADRLVDQGSFSDVSSIDVSVDVITIIPNANVSSVHYIRENVTGVGQTRILEVRISFEKR